MELERQAALAAKIDRAREREERRIDDSRRNVVREAGASRSAEEQAHLRTEEWSEAAIAALRAQALRPLAEAVSRRVTESRVEFLERRKERRQVEEILKEVEEKLAEERKRRAQRELDDWFSGKMLRRRRGRSGARLF